MFKRRAGETPCFSFQLTQPPHSFDRTTPSEAILQFVQFTVTDSCSIANSTSYLCQQASPGLRRLLPASDLPAATPGDLPNVEQSKQQQIEIAEEEAAAAALDAIEADADAIERKQPQKQQLQLKTGRWQQ